VPLFNPTPYPDETGFRERADKLTVWLAEKYAPAGSGDVLTIPQPIANVPDPQKYVFPKAIARLARDSQDAWARGIVAQFWDDGGAPAPHAAAFYHFAAFGLARLLFAFPDAVAPHRDALLKRAMREEQLFSATGTENHIAMWRTSGYLFAQEANDAKRLAGMRAWALDWRDRVYRLGQGEWDSSTYASFDIASWLNLFDYARDPEVKAAAKQVVDFFAGALALKYVHGAFAGAEKRGFSSGSSNTIASYTAWLWYDDTPRPVNDAFFSQSALYTITPALSAYRPSADTLTLARKTAIARPTSYRIGRPNYAMTRPSETREVLYVTRRYAVGTSVCSPIGGWGGGDTQETLWKFAARGDAATGTSAYVIGGAGAGYAARNRYIGEGRSPWDQAVQWEDVVIVMTRVPENAESLTADAKSRFDVWRQTKGAKPEKVSWSDPVPQPWAYLSLPANAEIEEIDGILFVNLGGSAYAAVRPLHGAYTWMNAADPNQPKDRRIALTQAGRSDLLGWAIEFGDRDTDGDFAAFQRAAAGADRLKVEGLTATYRSRRNVTVAATFVPNGTYTQPEYDWGPQPAWPSGEGHGRVPRLAVNGREVDLSEVWPVYGGATSASGTRSALPESPGA
jgi:hypothetical protein